MEPKHAVVVLALCCTVLYRQGKLHAVIGAGSHRTIGKHNMTHLHTIRVSCNTLRSVMEQLSLLLLQPHVPVLVASRQSGSHPWPLQYFSKRTQRVRLTLAPAQCQ